jgi:hypothetical protein
VTVIRISPVRKNRGSGFYWGTGTGAFGPGQTFVITPQLAQGLAAADFNSDGRQDIAVLGSSNTVVTLLNNGTGGFKPGALWTAGTEPWRSRPPIWTTTRNPIF